MTVISSKIFWKIAK